MDNINDKNIHIDSIRNNLGISLKTISDYNLQNREEIQNIKDIFLSEGNNKEKVLALLYLFSIDEDDYTVKRYRDETGLLDVNYNRESELITRYNIMLVTALIYNPHFYAMTQNYIGAVKAGVPVTENKDSSSPVSFRKIHSMQHFPSKSLTKTFSKRTMYIAASAASVLIAFFIMLTFFNRGEKSIYTPMLAGLSGSDTGQLFVINPFLDNIRSVGTSREYKKILNEHSVLIKHNPDSAELYLNRGIDLLKNGYVNSAINDFTTAINLSSFNSSAHYYLALAYTGMENPDYNNAIENINKALGTFELRNFLAETPGIPYDDSDYLSRPETTSAIWEGTSYTPEGPTVTEESIPPAFRDMSNLSGRMSSSEMPSDLSHSKDDFLINEAYYLLGTIRYQQFKDSPDNKDYLSQSITAFEHIKGYRNTDDVLLRLENLK